jgi:putative Mn2+ efflux pump MntP
MVMTLIPPDRYIGIVAFNQFLFNYQGELKMNTSENQNIVTLFLKAVAVGMSVVSIVLGFIPNAGDVNTQITLLSIGLAALAVAALQKEN